MNNLTKDQIKIITDQNEAAMFLFDLDNVEPDNISFLLKKYETSTASHLLEDDAFEALDDIQNYLIPEFLTILNIDESDILTDAGFLKATVSLRDDENNNRYCNYVNVLNLILNFTLAPDVFLNNKNYKNLKTTLQFIRKINVYLVEINELY